MQSQYTQTSLPFLIEKRCPRCKQVLPVSAFAPNKRRFHGIECYCRDCARRVNNQWRQAHPERQVEYTQNYLAQPGKRAAAVARAVAWGRANPEKARRNKKHWKIKNPDKVVAEAQKRRGLEAGAVDYAAILERDGMVCHICGDAIPDRSVLHFDHVIPLARGGKHTAENIRPSHALCNLRKGAKMPDEISA